MGTDIGGAIECRTSVSRHPGRPWPWTMAVDLDLLYEGRGYDAFGCLFGVRNYAHFRPVAADRGLPDDLSDGAVRLPGVGGHDPTWVTWTEIDAVDWDEFAEQPDSRVRQYRREADGSLTPMGKASFSPDLAALVGLSVEEARAGTRTWPEGTEWQIGDLVYRSERMRRRHAVPADGDWAPVWAVMGALASVHGGDNVRLVVWFDS